MPPPPIAAQRELLPPVYGPAFGTVTPRTSHRVPRRDAFLLDSHVSLPQLPLSTALHFLWELVTGLGSVRVRAMGFARVRAARQEVTVWVDCLQEVAVVPLPVPQITKSVCTYALEAGGGGGGGMMGVGAWLEEGLVSMDFGLDRPPLPAAAATMEAVVAAAAAA